MVGVSNDNTICIDHLHIAFIPVIIPHFAQPLHFGTLPNNYMLIIIIFLSVQRLVREIMRFKEQGRSGRGAVVAAENRGYRGRRWRHHGCGQRL